MLVTMQLATGAPLRPTWEADAWTLSVDVDAVELAPDRCADSLCVTEDDVEGGVVLEVMTAGAALSVRPVTPRAVRVRII